jgi:hypothetical protein
LRDRPVPLPPFPAPPAQLARIPQLLDLQVRHLQLLDLLVLPGQPVPQGRRQPLRDQPVRPELPAPLEQTAPWQVQLVQQDQLGLTVR